MSFKGSERGHSASDVSDWLCQFWQTARVIVYADRSEVTDPVRSQHNVPIFRPEEVSVVMNGLLCSHSDDINNSNARLAQLRGGKDIQNWEGFE